MDAESIRERSHALNRLIAALAHDIRRTELPGELDAVGMMPEEDDLFGAKPPGGDHAAQAHRAVADYGRGLPGADPGRDRGMMAGPHDVGEGEK